MVLGAYLEYFFNQHFFPPVVEGVGVLPDGQLLLPPDAFKLIGL
jgi:Na+-transporting NADH:ubiquinone oxidoreductase subunit NqrD